MEGPGELVEEIRASMQRSVWSEAQIPRIAPCTCSVCTPGVLQSSAPGALSDFQLLVLGEQHIGQVYEWCRLALMQSWCLQQDQHYNEVDAHSREGNDVCCTCRFRFPVTSVRALLSWEIRILMGTCPCCREQAQGVIAWVLASLV